MAVILEKKLAAAAAAVSFHAACACEGALVQASIYLLCNGPRAARSLSKDISTVSHSVLSAAHTSPASHTKNDARGERKKQII